MPLSPRKAAHVKKMIDKWFLGRDQLITLTLRTPTGGTTQLLIRGIWRVVGDFNPTYEGPTNALTHLGTESDILAELKTSDVTLSQLRATIYAELGADATGVQPAGRYTLTDIETAGMLPGGDRYITRWTRQH